MQRTVNCIRCGVPMEVGKEVSSNTYGEESDDQRWEGNTAERIKLWVFSWKDKRRLQVYSRRCPSCGMLERCAFETNPGSATA